MPSINEVIHHCDKVERFEVWVCLIGVSTICQSIPTWVSRYKGMEQRGGRGHTGIAIFETTTASSELMIANI